MERKKRGAREPVYEVVWPLGEYVPRPLVQPAPALTDLNGKTIGEMWDGVFRGDQIYPILNEELRKRFPDIKIVDHRTMGNTHGTNEREYVADLPNLLQQQGCDAVISAVGA
jgi:hypothetical protein